MIRGETVNPGITPPVTAGSSRDALGLAPTLGQSSNYQGRPVAEPRPASRLRTCCCSCLGHDHTHAVLACEGVIAVPRAVLALLGHWQDCPAPRCSSVVHSDRVILLVLETCATSVVTRKGTNTYTFRRLQSTTSGSLATRGCQLPPSHSHDGPNFEKSMQDRSTK